MSQKPKAKSQKRLPVFILSLLSGLILTGLSFGLSFNASNWYCSSLDTHGTGSHTYDTGYTTNYVQHKRGFPRPYFWQSIKSDCKVTDSPWDVGDHLINCPSFWSGGPDCGLNDEGFYSENFIVDIFIWSGLSALGIFVFRKIKA
jgi:hypothetical protein